MSGPSWKPTDDNPFADPSVSAARSGPGAKGGSDAPGWLRGGSASAASAPPPPPPPPPQGHPSVTSTAAPSTQQAAARPPNADVPKMVLYMRVANIVLSGFISTIAVFTLLSIPDISGAVLAIYLVMFSCLLCCFETHLKVVSKTIAANFGFLYNCKGRAVFLLFLGIICFSFGVLLGYVAGILMLGNSAFNFYVIFKFPEIEEQQQRKDLESEGYDYLRNNQDSIARAGADYARNNPEQARQVARAAATYV